MASITRRNFLMASAAASVAAMLAACGQSQDAEAPAAEGDAEAPVADGSYPIEPEERGRG